jgi:hemolysin III
MVSYPTDSVSQVALLGPVGVDDAVTGAADALARPRLRGWIHFYCAVAAFFAGTTLVVMSWALVSKVAGHATLAYALAIVAMFAVSATYHRVSWQSAISRQWMRRLDHSMIFVLIAGTYTPFATLAMPRGTGHLVLAIVWGGALAGIALALFWPSAPRWLSVTLYLLLGWVAVWYMGTILHNAGAAAMVLLAVGGMLYSVGAVFYGLRRPDPWPITFG